MQRFCGVEDDDSPREADLVAMSKEDFLAAVSNHPILREASTPQQSTSPSSASLSSQRSVEPIVIGAQGPPVPKVLGLKDLSDDGMSTASTSLCTSTHTSRMQPSTRCPTPILETPRTPPHETISSQFDVAAQPVGTVYGAEPRTPLPELPQSTGAAQASHAFNYSASPFPEENSYALQSTMRALETVALYQTDEGSPSHGTSPDRGDFTPVLTKHTWGALHTVNNEFLAAVPHQTHASGPDAGLDSTDEMASALPCEAPMSYCTAMQSGRATHHVVVEPNLGLRAMTVLPRSFTRTPRDQRSWSR